MSLLNLHGGADDPRAARRLFLAVAAVTLAFKLVLAAMLPITGDEAYFIVWGRHPDWGFYDHPPMVGWWLAALSQVSGHPLVLRLPALLVPLAVGFIVAATLARHGAALAWSAATLVLLVPLNAWNVAITTDVPLMFFLAATVAAYLRALRTGRAADWLLTGLLLGGALLSKYFAGLLALAIFGHLVSRPSGARLRGLALVVAASLPAVVLQAVWNSQNCWPNLMFNLVNRHGNAGWSFRTPLVYLVSLAYVLTPPVAWALARRAMRRGDAGERGSQAGQVGQVGPVPHADAVVGQRAERTALSWLAGLPFALFALLSTFKTIGLHWLAGFVAPSVMLFALAVDRARMARALRFAAGFALLHYVVIGALAAAPIEWFQKTRSYDGLVMTLRPQALNERIAPYLGRFEIAAQGYSPAVTIGFNLGRDVFVFGVASGHARHDDMLTDFRALAGRDILVISKDAPVAAEYEPYFERVVYRQEQVLGATFHFVEGYGFRYEAYRDGVLDEIRRRWYAVPTWLPKGPCYFCDRYFPDRACHR